MVYKKKKGRKTNVTKAVKKYVSKAIAKDNKSDIRFSRRVLASSATGVGTVPVYLGYGDQVNVGLCDDFVRGTGSIDNIQGSKIKPVRIYGNLKFTPQLNAFFPTICVCIVQDKLSRYTKPGLSDIFDYPADPNFTLLNSNLHAKERFTILYKRTFVLNGYTGSDGNVRFLKIDIKAKMRPIEFVEGTLIGDINEISNGAILTVITSDCASGNGAWCSGCLTMEYIDN